MPVELTISGPAAKNLKGGAVKPGEAGRPVIVLDPVQVAGLAPMTSCTDSECRETCIPCYENIVFGTSTAPGGTRVKPKDLSYYENDVNGFWVDVSLYGPQPSITVTWKIQECVNNEWSDIHTITNNNYGFYYALNSVVGHPTYTGVYIDWGRVLFTFGPGVYRVKVNTDLRTIVGCLVSDKFRLVAWNCDRAHRTTKFETIMNGTIGDINKDGRLFDVCAMDLYDSIRVGGFFGKETTPEYLEILNEYQNGQVNRVRDEAVQKFQWSSTMLPKAYHDRIKAYALMADMLYVSDYNRNNSDFNIKKKQVIKAGAYEPNYVEHSWLRMQMVTVDFKEGIQRVIKSSCCERGAAG